MKLFWVKDIHPEITVKIDYPGATIHTQAVGAEDYQVPFNELHQKGFISIGCEPCTRPVLPNQHEREGRSWREESEHKECGLHIGNLIPTKQA